MARRRPYEKIDINVEPFLSIMAIVLKLISLILVVIVMRIAINPHAKKIVNPLEEEYTGRGNTQGNPKIPSYIDCHPDCVVLYPGGAKVDWDSLQHPGNPVDQLLDKVTQHKEDEYIVVMVRPGSLKYYRTIRNLIAKTPVDVGSAAVDANFKVNWDAALKALAISE
jgi:hypothetical protein